MKKIIIGVLVIAGLIYLYLVLAVNTKKKELQQFKKKIESDSASYHSNKKLDSNNKAP
jgi:hypothetical protein